MMFLIAILIILAGLILYVAVKTPKMVRISRTILIDREAPEIFPYINEPKRIQEWNPFTDSDPDVKITFEGPVQGVGAIWIWEGKRAGAGQATIRESELNKRVGLQLNFKRPFHVTNFGEYTLESKGNQTEARWIIDETHRIPRVMSNFVDLDKLIGLQFERGLTKLKMLCEATK